MDQADTIAGGVKRAAASRPHRLVRNLIGLYGGSALVVAVLLSAAVWPFAGLARLRALAAEAIAHGLGVTGLSVLLLATVVLLATFVVTASRRPRFGEGIAADADAAATQSSSWSPARISLQVAARQAQGLILSLGALLIGGVVWLIWPAPSAPGTVESDANLLAGIAFALSFFSLVAERIVKEFPAPQLPEAPSLRRLLLLTTLILLVAGCFQVAHGAGFGWVRWPVMVVAVLPLLISVELAGRALARQFLPDAPESEATAVTESILVTLITGGPRAPAMLIRTHLGLDFARSWAVRYLKSAALPAAFATAVLCWGLSGLKLIEFGQRGVYERLGAPVSVLGPGLHLLPPWPLGRLRPVEFGTNHMFAVGSDQPTEVAEQIRAEDTPPPALNHLWAAANPAETTYLVASPSTGQQGFQAVSAEIRVLYRIGLTDAQALQSIYGVANPEALVKEAASQQVAQYFASHTLDAVMGERRETLAELLRSTLARDVAVQRGGIEIVAVLVEAIHPPVGAAAAYHAVQAAEINADASVSNETGRAVRTAGVAQQEARQALNAAEATAFETEQVAKGDAYRFEADRGANSLNPAAFLLERSYGSLKAALNQRRMTIVDHRISAEQGPMIDMRSSGKPDASAGANGRAADAGRAAPRPPGIIEMLPGTSTEGAPPPLTSEEGEANKRPKNEPADAK
jgi:regulator of protease activity HflC (stomatin/prohibitin superfamily)